MSEKHLLVAWIRDMGMKSALIWPPTPRIHSPVQMASQGSGSGGTRGPFSAQLSCSLSRQLGSCHKGFIISHRAALRGALGTGSGTREHFLCVNRVREKSGRLEGGGQSHPRYKWCRHSSPGGIYAFNGCVYNQCVICLVLF